jgi:hypothetical protein
MRRAAVLVVALTLVSFSLPAQSRPTLQFTFDWSPGTRADITTLARSAGTTVFPNDTFFIRGRSTLDVEGHAEGRVIRTSSVKIDSVWPQIPGPAMNMAALPFTVSRSSAVIVRSSGEFVALFDTVQVRKSVDSLMGMLAGRSGAPASPGAATLPVIAMSSLAASARKEWEQQTTSLLSRSWTIGEEIADSAEDHGSTRAGSSLRIPQTTMVVGVEPCDATSPALLCARVRRVQSIDTLKYVASILESVDTTRADVRRLFADFGPKLSSVITHDMFLEVKTLRARQLVQSVVQSSTFNGISQRVETTITTTYRYTSR